MPERKVLESNLEIVSKIGTALDSELEKASGEAKGCAHASSLLKEYATKHVTNLHAKIDADFEDGKIPGITDLETLSYMKKLVTVAGEAMKNKSQELKAMEMVALGKATGLRSAVNMAQRYANSSAAQIQQIIDQEAEIMLALKEEGLKDLTADAEEEPVPQAKVRRKPGTKPKSKLNDRRKEAKKAQMAEKISKESAE